MDTALASVTYTALDGGVVEIRGQVDLTSPFTSMVVGSFAGRMHEFTSGLRTFGSDLAVEVGVGFDEEYFFQSGLLRLGSAVQVDPGSGVEHLITIAAWEGISYGIVTSVYEGDRTYLIGLFDQFAIEEQENGVVLLPRDAQTTPIEVEGTYRPALVKLLPGIALLEVRQATPGAEALLPSWHGRRVKGGELFAQGTARVPSFIIVGDTAITVVYPNDGVSEAAISGALASLVIDWHSDGDR